MDPGKRMIELEAVSNWLEEENRSLVVRSKVLTQIEKLKGEVMAIKDREERWSKAEEKCKHLEFEKGKLEMDLKAAEAENKALHRTLEEERKEKTYWLVQSLEASLKAYEKRSLDEKEKGEMKAEVVKLKREIGRQKEQISNDKMVIEAKEKKVTEFVQRIKVLEKENVKVKAEKMTVKEGGEKKIKELGQRIDIMDREKQRLTEEHMQRIDVIKVLVQEKECLDVKLQKLKMEMNKWTVNVKLEDNADLPHNNVGNPTQNQGKKSAKRTRPSI